MALGSHYGGRALSVARDEVWTKVVGPFALYPNALPAHEAMWKDVPEQAGREAARGTVAWSASP